MRTRKAILPDAVAIHSLISQYTRDGTLLPRELGEVCENIRDFTVVERSGAVLACGALHLYGLHLAEIRSIAVDREQQGSGLGRRLISALVAESRQHQVAQVCLFTRVPKFFDKLSFAVVAPETLPDKIWKDCRHCPRFNACDEIAMVYTGAEATVGIRIGHADVASGKAIMS